MGEPKTIVFETTTTTRLEIHEPQPNPQQQTTATLPEEHKTPAIENATGLFPIMREILPGKDESGNWTAHFWLVGLRADNRVLYIESMNPGGTGATIINPVEVYRLAVINSSSYIMLVQSRADGTLEPSESDKRITQTLLEGGMLLGIRIVDHLIISKAGYCSLLDEGLAHPKAEEE